MQVSSFIGEIPSLEEILFAGHTALLQLLVAALHTQAKPKCCVPLFLSLMAYEMYFKSESGEDSQKVSTARRVTSMFQI